MYIYIFIIDNIIINISIYIKYNKNIMKTQHYYIYNKLIC